MMVTLHEVKIENLTNWMRSLRLNSGVVLHLPPRATSEVIASVEVQGNTEVDKLLLQSSISVHKIAASTPEVESNTNTDEAELNTNAERGSTPSIGE